ncbi:MAG: hypothetical protein R2822_03360 [Spirosomataceae bacterium]
MKKSLMFLLLVFVSFNTFSKGVKIKSTIEEDPKALFIKIEVLREGKFSHFKKSYDVSGKISYKETSF